MFEDFFTNERDKGFLAHVDIGRALGSQSGNLFAYPSANLLVVFGSHSFSLGRTRRKGNLRTLDRVFTSTTRVVNFGFADFPVLLSHVRYPRMLDRLARLIFRFLSSPKEYRNGGLILGLPYFFGLKAETAQNDNVQRPSAEANDSLRPRSGTLTPEPLIIARLSSFC